ncbi:MULTISPECIES: VOC family protein [Streptomyces violaceusniger group]|uniref:VOC family protein n=1 Tax=Streptomyces rhizosphaericus TaxID=114699 RepID=A0ABP4C5M9_9ACTN|nr:MULTISPECIES: VOC family protein [Streptomyces violaceusniger group]
MGEIEIPAGTAPGPVDVDVHDGLHSELGALRGEHPGRARNPVIKVVELGWLEFVKPDLDRAEHFARDFGFVVHDRTPDRLSLRGTWSALPCLVIRRGRHARFVGPTFVAESTTDVRRLARWAGANALPLGSGQAVQLTDPSGFPVRVAAGLDRLSALPERDPLDFNFGTKPIRLGTTQRPPRGAAEVQRLGHVVLETPRFRNALEWYLEALGLIVSDFLYLDELRDRGPTMAFLRCDLGPVPADHHTLAMHLGPRAGYVHSAYQVTDLDAVAAGGAYLADQGYHRVWGIGRHIQGSQIFDYWHDPDRMMLEHYADGDLFDSSLEPGWAPMSASGLSQWGPPVSRDFLGSKPTPGMVTALLKALGDKTNDIDKDVLKALAKAMAA